MDDKSGLGIVEIILLLAVFIIFILIFWGELTSGTEWIFQDLFTKVW